MTQAAAVSPKIVPPDSTFRGLNMAEWYELKIRVARNSPTIHPDKVDKTTELPGDGVGSPAGVGTQEDPLILSQEGEGTYNTGTAFRVDSLGWLGEIYEDGSLDPTLPDSWWGTYITGTVILDGETILADLSQIYIPVHELSPPISYPAPTPYGSVGVGFFQGAFFILKPLPPGEHVLELETVLGVPPDNGVTPETWITLRGRYTLNILPLVGDLDGNGCVNRADLDLLMAQIRSRTGNLDYDINGDGRLDSADARSLVLKFSNPNGAACE